MNKIKVIYKDETEELAIKVINSIAKKYGVNCKKIDERIVFSDEECGPHILHEFLQLFQKK